MMGFVIGNLFGTTTIGLINGHLHRASDTVSVHDDMTIDVACSTTSSLRERTMVTQETLLIGIKDSHQTHLRQVQSLSQ